VTARRALGRTRQLSEGIRLARGARGGQVGAGATRVALEAGGSISVGVSAGSAGRAAVSATLTLLDVGDGDLPDIGSIITGLKIGIILLEVPSEPRQHSQTKAMTQAPIRDDKGTNSC
jgi:type III secretory pathway component EscV